MKEQLNQKLANEPQNTYSRGVPRFNRGGDIFMADGPGNGEGSPKPTAKSSGEVQKTPLGPTAPKPEQNPQRKTPRDVLGQEAFEAKWEDHIESRRGKIPTDEMQTLNIMREKGLLPFAGGAQQPGEPEGEPAEQPPESSAAGGENKASGDSHSNQEQGDGRAIADKKAAELIGRFRGEGGEKDSGRIQQLRRDLSQRIDELMKEQWVLGDSDEVKTPEGKAVVDAKIDELNDRISQIQGAIAETYPPSQETSRRGNPEIGRIVMASEEFVNGLRGRGLRLDQINDLSRLTPEEKVKRAALVHDIKAFLQDTYSLQSSSFDPDILLAVRHFKELREELISDIIFKSFEDRSETNEYEVNLYADSNLNTLMGFLSKDDNERYRDFFSLRTATRFFQSMNATVIKGTFDSFGQAAENINYQHFENMRDIRGSGLAMRLYEQAYRDILASDKRVTQDKIAEIKKFVETTFEDMNEAGLITSEYSQYRPNSKMENWEIQRALAAGRSFLNITLRAAENIATGQVPTDRKRYTSPPQEDMIRILNWNQWLLTRFGVGGGKEGRHGEEFLKMTTDRYQDFLRYKGAKLGINAIAEFGGVDVRKMEDGSQYKTSGVYSGWRLENMAFDEIYFNYGGERLSVQKFRDQPEIKDRIKSIKDRIEEKKKRNPNMDPKDQVAEEDQKEYRDALMPVVNNLNIGLSMLLKNGDFGAQDNKLGYLLRVEIWKKIARTNIPLMMDYLTDIKYEDGTPDAERALTIGGLRESIVPQWSEIQWESFRKKVLIKFERTIKEGMGENLPSVNEELSADEKRLEEAIKTQGEKLAPHLADVVFAYTPFMNDMPFEKFRYDFPGQTFYKRRTTGDLGGYNKGQQAYTKILDNPGGIPAKEAVEAMGEIVAGVASPEGPRTGMESNFPTFSALLDVVAADEGKRQAIAKMLLEATRNETSIAQRWSGIKADSFIESELASLVDNATRAGILNPELARYLKKNKHLTFSAILWMLFRDVFVMVPVFAAGEFAGTFKGK